MMTLDGADGSHALKTSSVASVETYFGLLHNLKHGINYEGNNNHFFFLQVTDFVLVLPFNLLLKFVKTFAKRMLASGLFSALLA